MPNTLILSSTGAERNLYCYFRNVGKGEPIIVSNMNGMQKVCVISNIDQIVFLDSGGQLMHTSLRQFVAFLKTTQNCTQVDAPKFQCLSSDKDVSAQNEVTLFEVIVVTIPDFATKIFQVGLDLDSKYFRGADQIRIIVTCDLSY